VASPSRVPGSASPDDDRLRQETLHLSRLGRLGTAPLVGPAHLIAQQGAGMYGLLLLRPLPHARAGCGLRGVLTRTPLGALAAHRVPGIDAAIHQRLSIRRSGTGADRIRSGRGAEACRRSHDVEPFRDVKGSHSEGPCRSGTPQREAASIPQPTQEA